MPFTIYDVAMHAGYSISTVSRVLNNRAHVTPDARRKILAACEELNYTPSSIARGLVARKVNLVEVFFSWHLQSPWFTDLLDGVNEVVQGNDFGLLLNTLAGPGVFRREEVRKRVFRNAVDGILMVAPYLSEDEILQMTEKGIPMVLIGYRTMSGAVNFVDSDNRGGASAVVDHLAGLGHKRIACITGPVESSPNAADRLQGFRESMARHRLEVRPNYVVEGDFVRKTGGEALRRLLALPQPPTAVFASNDLMALGAWDAAEGAGLTVGKDLDLVGFDDMEAGRHPPYSLTTVRQDFRVLGATAAKRLLDMVLKEGTGAAKQISVPTQLIVRSSTRAPGVGSKGRRPSPPNPSPLSPEPAG